MSENLNQNSVESKPFSWWERLKYVFTSPNKAFENLAQYPKILFPMLVIPAGIILLFFARIGLYKEFLRDIMLQQYSNMGVEVPPMLDSILSVQAYSTMIITAVTIILAWLLKSAIINGLSGFVDGNGTFKQSFSIVAYSYFPVLLGAIITTILSLVVGEFNIMTSLAILLPESMMGTFIYTVFANIDIFIIWYQILAIIGISKAYNVSKGKAAILVLGTWIVYILISAGLGAAGNMVSQKMM
ncbi:Yip1 family protein [Brassicibacter mesophilus]|uniref:Yip1 family protein n=1 Tax=Brassicibacter mesophilus TaxID=745119 RepID=UPI003D233B62